MNLVEVNFHQRKFHVYSFKKCSPLSLDSCFGKIIFDDVSSLTIGKLFKMVKTSLDMKCEVLIINEINYSPEYCKLHQKHLHHSLEKYFYLNISIRNKLVCFFHDESMVHNINSLAGNNKLLNFFSN